MTTNQSDGVAGRRSNLYTPEAVRVDLPLADLGSRTLAIIIDLILMGILLYIVSLAVVLAASLAAFVDGAGPGWLLIVLSVALSFGIFWGYPVGLETRLRGRTPGKAALGLRVVTLDGGPIRFRHAAVRGLLAFVDFYLFLGIPALITSMVTRKGQRLGDLAAGTVTIRDRAPSATAGQAIAFAVPPALQSYAATLDVRGLSAADYATIRRFLLRAKTFDARNRNRVAVDLANALSGKMAHRPPAGTHPEALLLCVAALMQQTGGGTPQPVQGTRPPPGRPSPVGLPPAVAPPPSGQVAPPPQTRSDQAPNDDGFAAPT